MSQNKYIKGFYWVKTPIEYDGEEKWQIAFYNGCEEGWELCGQDGGFEQNYFLDIRLPNIAAPTEY